ncbi:MAG: hypothetical protein HYY10_03865 [Candidatus Liptonbacteria bacterium]|nr:hypothetical protein [Candidatus Liptonbacteria bacterium]
MTLALTVIRWILGVVCALFLAALVLVTVGIGVPATKLASSDYAKQVLTASGIYERASDIGVDFVLVKVRATAQGAAAPGDVKSMSRRLVDGSELRREVHDLFPPEWIRAQAEANIEGLYWYLRGGPAFTPVLDVAGRERAAQQSLGGIFKGKINGLPACASGVAGDMNRLDIFSTTCWPANLKKAEAHAKIDDALKDAPILKSGQLNLENPDAKVLANIEPVRRAYKVAASLPPLLVSLIALLFALSFFLIPGKIPKIAVPAGILGATGLVLSGAALLFRTQFGNVWGTFAEPRLVSHAPWLNDALETLASAAMHGMTGGYLLWGFFAIVLGALFLLTLHYPAALKAVTVAIAIMGIAGVIGTAAFGISIQNRIAALRENTSLSLPAR